MEKELFLNGQRLMAERDVKGTLRFFRVLQDGHKIEIDTIEEHIADALESTLWQLENLKKVLGRDEEEEPGPLYYLLDDMLQTARLKIDTLCMMIEEEFGKIKVYQCKAVVPGVLEGTFLGVSRKNVVEGKEG